jgi:hypothetical protein
MVTDKELEGYAQDCIRLAGMTDDPAIREPLLKMARDWIELARAEQVSENLHKADPPARHRRLEQRSEYPEP